MPCTVYGMNDKLISILSFFRYKNLLVSLVSFLSFSVCLNCICDMMSYHEGMFDVEQQILVEQQRYEYGTDGNDNTY